jgi:hypothetical protein
MQILNPEKKKYFSPFGLRSQVISILVDPSKKKGCVPDLKIFFFRIWIRHSELRIRVSGQKKEKGCCFLAKY